VRSDALVVQKRSKARKIPRWISTYFPVRAKEIAAWYFGMKVADKSRVAVDKLWSGTKPLYTPCEMVGKINGIRSASDNPMHVAMKIPVKNAAYERAAKKRRAAAAAALEQAAPEQAAPEQAAPEQAAPEQAAPEASPGPKKLGSIQLTWSINKKDKVTPFSVQMGGDKTMAEAIVKSPSNARNIAQHIAARFCKYADTLGLREADDLVTTAMVEIMKRGLSSALFELQREGDETKWTLKIKDIALVKQDHRDVNVRCKFELVFTSPTGSSTAEKGGAAGTKK
jgi:hypothetical protein